MAVTLWKAEYHLGRITCNCHFLVLLEDTHVSMKVLNEVYYTAILIPNARFCKDVPNFSSDP